MWPTPQFPADLVTFTEKIINRKLHFCAVLKGLGGSLHGIKLVSQDMNTAR